MRKYAILVLIAVLSASCVKENTSDIVPTGAVTLYAGVGSAEARSRATRGTAASDSGILNPSTEKALKIGMVRIDENKDADYPYFLNCGEPVIADLGTPDAGNGYLREITPGVAQFFRNATDAIRFAGWYPWAEDYEALGYKYSSDGNGTSVTLPIDGQTDIMYGRAITGTYGKGFNVMEFEHALCQYRIYAYTMTGTEVDEIGRAADNEDIWGKITDMSILALPDSCTMTIRKDTGKPDDFDIAYGNEKSDIVLSDKANNIYFNPSERLPVGISNRTLVARCVAAPPSEGVMTLYITTSKATASQKVSIARNFKAGYAYDIVLRFSDHGFINADISVADWENGGEIDKVIDIDMFYDLSTYETANCYHVASANYGYCFKGTVKGNGNGALTGVTNTAIPDDCYVDVLWDDTPKIDISVDGVTGKQSSFHLVSHYLSQGKVLFEVIGTTNDYNDETYTDKRLKAQGNVVVAAYKDESKSEILWTWHIWISDRVRTHGYTNGYLVHDRNLGAVNNNPNSVGSSIHQTASSDTGAAAMRGLYYQWGRPTPLHTAEEFAQIGKELATATGGVSAQTAVSNPTTIYSADDDWCSDPSAEQRWGWVSHYREPQKSIYDPCPPGYRIPDYRLWNDISQYAVEDSSHTKQDFVTGKGVHLSIMSNDVWYPFQNAISADDTNDKSATTVNLWSSSIDYQSKERRPYVFRYTASETSGISSDAEHAARYLAHPVRCISERTEEIITDLSASQTANCYMVHKRGYYKFNAMVRGNGVDKLLPLGGANMAYLDDNLNTQKPLSKTARIDVLWWQGDFTEVANEESDIDKYMCIEPLEKSANSDEGLLDDDGYCKFFINEFHKGNVILAAYDEFGEILWTWHIWLTDKPKDIRSGNYTLMDRFMGATYAPEITDATTTITFSSAKELMATYGFYYQWGRKDPFPGASEDMVANVMVNETKAAGRASDTSSSVWWYKNTDGTWEKKTSIKAGDAAWIADMTKDPTRFGKSPHGDWRGGMADTEWYPAKYADGYTNVALWGYAVANYDMGSSFNKTMHDPCPPGYRTPWYFVWRNIDYETGKYTVTNSYTYQDNNDVSISGEECNYSPYGFVTTLNTFDKMWFPYTGERSCEGGMVRLVGDHDSWDNRRYGRWWTGTPMGKYNTRSFYYLRNSYTGQQATADNSNGYGISSSYGLAVRCQKE